MPALTKLQMKNTFLALTTFTFVATQFAAAQDPTVAIPTEQSEAAAAEANKAGRKVSTQVIEGTPDTQYGDSVMSELGRAQAHTVRECYAVMGVVHAMWAPMPGRAAVTPLARSPRDPSRCPIASARRSPAPLVQPQGR